MLVQGGNNVYDKNEMLKKRALAVKVLENNKTLTSVQQQQLLKLIREIDNTLNTVELGKLDIASNCITNVSKSAKKHMGRKLAVTGICIVMIAIIAMAVYRRNEAQRRLQEYNENIHLVSLMMIIGGSDAEEAGNLIKSVWSNCIHKKSDPTTDKFTSRYSGRSGFFFDDFNDALKQLFSDKDFKNTISNIESNQERVMDLMKLLKNPPKEFEEAYEALREYYDAYLTFTDLAINPAGSLLTYSNNFNNADTDLLNAYKTMQLYLDD